MIKLTTYLSEIVLFYFQYYVNLMKNVFCTFALVRYRSSVKMRYCDSAMVLKYEGAKRHIILCDDAIAR